MKNASVLVLMEWYDHPMRVGIGRYAAEQEWYLTVSDGCLTPRGWSGDGVLTLINTRSDIIGYVCKQSVPCVDLGDFRPDIPLPRVCGDHRLIGSVAADHLIERGYNHAAYFSIEHQRPHEQRGQGFCERFAEKTGHMPVSLIWADQPGSESDDWPSLNRWLIGELRKLSMPLAVFCYCDYDAAKLESACLEAGLKIPEDVAILGADNDTLICENIRVPLSSVRHDRVCVGYEGAALLDRLMQGEGCPAEPRLISPRGVELRASTDGFAVADPLARSVINFFREKIDQPIGVTDAALFTGLTPQKLEEHFSEKMGQTVYALLLSLRLFEARRLLALTRLSVKEIAARTGFCHAQHLNNVFKRIEHCTPTDYRKRETDAECNSDMVKRRSRKTRLRQPTDEHL